MQWCRFVRKCDGCSLCGMCKVFVRMMNVVLYFHAFHEVWIEFPIDVRFVCESIDLVFVLIVWLKIFFEWRDAFLIEWLWNVLNYFKVLWCDLFLSMIWRVVLSREFEWRWWCCAENMIGFEYACAVLSKGLLEIFFIEIVVFCGFVVCEGI